jgi:protein-S-isoprenylcysteine O-methyltransferase Ste14
VSKTKAVLSSAIVLYFVICFEILIMISPFAGFFYSAFNPVLLGLAKYPATKWLSSFFFTHMVVPPNGPLKVVRVMGSILFLLGIAVFVVCAVQVYSHKFLKRGAVLKGLYSWIRHPPVPRPQHCRPWPRHPLAEIHCCCFVALDDFRLLHLVER